MLKYNAKSVTNHKAWTYLVKYNPSGWLIRWLMLMEEFDIDINIVDCLGRWHNNVDGLIRAYERVGDVLEDDDFPNTIMIINAKKTHEEYQEIVQYLDGMRFPVGATKAVLTWIAHKSRNYSIRSYWLNFKGKDGVLLRTIRKGETSHLLYEFHGGFYGGHFVRWIIPKTILQVGYYSPTLFKGAHDYSKSCDACQAYAQSFTMNGPLHPVPPLGPFEKWGIELMGPLLMTRRGHRFIMVIKYYLTKLTKVRALKSLLK